MSIITKIRNRAGLLVGLIGLAIVSFLLMDVFSGNGIFASRPDTIAGEIDGDEIGIQYFETRVEEAIENYKANTQTDKVDENTVSMLREQAWNEVIRETLINKEYKALGLGVGLDELFDMVQGTNIHPSVRQAFTNPQTGQFDRAQVVSFLRNLDTQPEDMQKRWAAFEKYIKQERETQKYNNLIAKGLYVTKAAATRFAEASGKSYNGRFVLLDYATINDSSITVEESELKAYYEKNKKDYETKDETRNIDYVVFQVTANAGDTARALESVTSLVADFTASTNDSAFVMLNSDLPFPDQWVRMDQLVSEQEKYLSGAPAGTVSSVYLENNYFKVTKLVARGTRADSVRARHILIAMDNNPVAAKAKTDSLKKLIDGGADFAALATANSTDQGSAVKGGDLGYFAEGMMVKPFNDACFNGNKGDVVVVESQFGYHIINILDKKGLKPALKFGTIANAIEPSTDTYRDVFAQANKFQGENRDVEAFTKAVETEGLTKRTAEGIKIGDRTLPGFTNAREVVRWMHKAELNDVSNTFELEDKYVVAVLTKITPKGYKPFEDVKAEIETAVRRDKKAEKLLVQAKDAAAKNKDIMAAATSLNNIFQVFQGASFANNFMPSMGRELNVLGKITKAKIGEMLPPIKGERGVYLVVVDSVSTAPGMDNVEAMKMNLGMQISQRAQNEALAALRERVEITDKRYQFY